MFKINKIRSFFNIQSYLFKLELNISPFLTLFSILAHMLNSFLPIILSLIYKKLIDALETSYISMSVEQELYLAICVYLIGLFLVQLIRQWSGLISSEAGEVIQHRLNCDIMKKMSEHGIAFFDDPENKDSLDKINLFKSSIGSGISIGINIIMKLSSLMVSLFLFIPYNPVLGLLYILTYIPGSIVQYRLNKKMNQFYL